jgi:hypothetical protein
MRRKFTVELIVEFDVKPDYTPRDAARFVQSVLEDRFDSDGGDDRLVDITVLEDSPESQEQTQ